MIITEEMLFDEIAKYNKEELEHVKKALKVAKTLHKGQFRNSGEAYISHPIAVSYILAQMHADKNSLCAALLHDTLEDTPYTKDEMIKDFGPDIASLVDGVTNLSKLNFNTPKEAVYANFRKLLTGLVKDPRVVLIKLADRLHNMRTLEYKSLAKQQEKALETKNFYAPLAGIIGSHKIKTELELLSFMYLEPDEYKELLWERENASLKASRELSILKERVEFSLEQNKMTSEVNTRVKSPASIYRKMKKGYKLHDINDLYALKVTVSMPVNCYESLEVIKKLCGETDAPVYDFIKFPKNNLYRSLHMIINDNPLGHVQVQSTTTEFNFINDYGLAGYWFLIRGKALGQMKEDLEERFPFFPKLKQINGENLTNKEYYDEVIKYILGPKIFVCFDNKRMLEIPKNSQVADIIKEAAGKSILVNGEEVTSTKELHNKDKIEIVRSRIKKD